MSSDLIGLAAVVLIASPFYCYLVASLVFNVYFKAKLRYHHNLFSEIQPNRSQRSK